MKLIRGSAAIGAYLLMLTAFSDTASAQQIMECADDLQNVKGFLDMLGKSANELDAQYKILRSRAQEDSYDIEIVKWKARTAYNNFEAEYRFMSDWVGIARQNNCADAKWLDGKERFAEILKMLITDSAHYPDDLRRSKNGSLSSEMDR